jgi:ABC-type transporter lipoprotein component MlaA
MNWTIDLRTVPAVNMNGTVADELVELRRNAFDALGEAIEKVQAAMPHGRDYQTKQDKGAYQAARDIYTERLRQLEKMKREIMEEAMAIQDRLG